MPLFQDTDDAKYKNIIEIKIPNEANVLSAKFGWCIICRNPAPFFCKDTRVPICSVDCKKKHFTETETVSKVCLTRQAISDPYLEDCKRAFRLLIQISGKPGKMNYSNKQKVLALELIYHLLVYAEPVFSTQEELVEVMRSELVESVMYNSEGEKANWMLSYGVLVAVVYYYRDLLRNELDHLVEALLVRKVECPERRQLCLKALESILLNPGLALELFTNHDCSLGHNNVVQRMVEALAKHALEPACLALLDDMIRNMTHFLDSEPVLLDDLQDDDVKQILEKMEQLDNVEKQRFRKQQMQDARAKFNVKASLGFKYLVECRLIDDNQ